MNAEYQAKVRVFIPTYNSIESIDATLESLWGQSYNKEDIEIFIGDFGSEDGTYEKILKYHSVNLGIYAIRGTYRPEERLKEIYALADWSRRSGNYYYLDLKPGDILDAEFIQTAVIILDKCKDVAAVIAEADIWGRNGKTEKQIPLYNGDFILKKENKDEFLKRGYSHRVIAMRRQRILVTNYSSMFWNQTNFWNHCFFYCNGLDAAYIHRPMATIKEVNILNELDFIMQNYASLLGHFRTYNDSARFKVCNSEMEKAFYNLSLFAIWRSGYLLEQDKAAEAKKCFYMAEVIYPEIRKNKQYSEIKQKWDKRGCLKKIKLLLPSEETKEIII